MATTSTARAVYLPGARHDEAVFSLFHEPAEPASGTGLLVCPPFGWEDYCAYRALREVAIELAASGHGVLRIDLPSTGDSTGAPGDPDRFGAWTAAVAGAASWLRSEGRCARVAALGVGLGGFVVCSAVAAGAPIDDLALWAVNARGRSLLRELRAFATMNAVGIDPMEAVGDVGVAPPPKAPDGSLEVGGFLLSAETVSALEAAEVTALDLPPGEGRRVLLFKRDGIAPDAKLRERFEDRAYEVEVAPGDGYSAMLAHPQTTLTPLAELERLRSWLGSSAGVPGPAHEGRYGGRATVELEQSGISESELEVELAFGRIRGVLAQPLRSQGEPSVAAILLNAGALRRIGPGRVWTEVARRWAPRGIPTLRFDIEGVGDADGDGTPYADTGMLYDPRLVDQVLGAMDAMEAQGHGSRFLLLGLCSGSFWAYHAALRDPRVKLAYLINPRALHWHPYLDETRDIGRMPTRALEASAWARVARGEIPISRLAHIATASIRTPIRNRRFRAAERRVRLALDRDVEHLARLGTRILFLFGQQEPLHDELAADGYLERFATLPHCDVRRLPGSDHTFRPLASQHYVHSALEEALEADLKDLREPTEARPLGVPGEDP